MLLDEINLASPETLECISGLLQGPTSSITLAEQGSLDPVPRHPSFRLFACMNPATDVGKRDLPANIRTRFTEIDVPPPDDDPETLRSIISQHIGHLAVKDKAVIFDVAQFYTSMKSRSTSGQLSDTSNKRPHYSMRTLSRALQFSVDTAHLFGLRRAVWEGFAMAFMMSLDEKSTQLVFSLARTTLLSSVKNVPAFLVQQSSGHNTVSKNDIQFGPFSITRGPHMIESEDDYVLTQSVQKKVTDLARIIMTRRYPILIEGPTSSGKTSAVQYLARRTGHVCVRINNHEHTDIQEYMGSYVSDKDTGRLEFRDGLLVRALRRGEWIILDELNLAPTDVLEALNRLLDDNRELVIPETNEVVRPHPDFMLFATQNPPGLYGGRKVLSRALRNRFLEVHFDDVPSSELEHILCVRSQIPPSYSQRIVSVFHELQKRRQVGRIFEGKHGFATLRDLFRWAGRRATSYQELAEHGFMLLGERARLIDDRQVVKEVLQEIMKVRLDETILYKPPQIPLMTAGKIVWTRSMYRLFNLLASALERNEPVLLVGDTGCGKTTVCQVYAELFKQKLMTVNCHQNTEASDIVGGHRPARNSSKKVEWRDKVNGLFVKYRQQKRLEERRSLLEDVDFLLSIRVLDETEIAEIQNVQKILQSSAILTWKNGPLVDCMRNGDMFLLDEISLADDSVLERLNSVLEPSRTIVLAEKGGEQEEDFQIVASERFKFVATMNPGGDFGKKELSPALRNRFTEIWVPPINDRNELESIISNSFIAEDLEALASSILDFVDWFGSQVKDASIITLRDILVSPYAMLLCFTY